MKENFLKYPLTGSDKCTKCILTKNEPKGPKAIEKRFKDSGNIEKIDEISNNDNLCNNCFENPKNSALVPCGHVYLCESCSSKLVKKRGNCEICNSTASSALKVHIS